MAQPHGEYTVHGMDMLVVNDYFDVQGFETLRKCPACGKRLRSNGNGSFWCLGCEYRDSQDVSALKASDLDYHMPVNHSWLNRYFGYR